MPSLTQKDIKELKYQCRMGYIIPLMVLLISNMIIFLAVYTNDLSYTNPFVLLAVSASVVFEVFLNIKMNHNYLADIRNGIKKQEIKQIRLKEAFTDYEAGSATLFVTQKMNPYTRYNIIVNNTRYRVEKEFYENCNEGDEVVFYFAPQSNYLLTIELKKPIRT